MEIIFTKGKGRYGYLKCNRFDQTSTETKMPEQGIAPHDLIHFVVEKTLQITGAFYGQLKAGADISFKLEHNELSRQISNRIDVWQTESMVESLQSLLWAENLSFESFEYLFQQACKHRNLPVRDVSEYEFCQMTKLLIKLNEKWERLEANQSISVEF